MERELVAQGFQPMGISGPSLKLTFSKGNKSMNDKVTVPLMEQVRAAG
jgi:hypothetical protein